MAKEARQALMSWSPEASLARLIARRENFQPGDDLLKLVGKYAEVEYLLFPVDAVDGISLYLKDPDRRPNIIINSSIPETRAKFTLAHEFGHVIIPWHFGMIFSNIDSFSRSTNFAYREIEAEANKFAAELLMPRNWLQSLHEEHSNPARMAQIAQRICKTSMASVIIAVNNALPPGYVYVRTAGDEIVLSSMSSYGTFVASFAEGENYVNSPRYDECTQIYEYQFNDMTHIWLSFESEKGIDIALDARSWREILNEIIADTDPDNTQPNIKQSVNGIIAVCNNRATTAESFFAAARQTFTGRGPLYQRILAHPQFDSFLVKRIKEFMARKK